MTPQEQEYWDKNNNEKAALDYGVANGTIMPEDALTADDLKDAEKKAGVPVNESKATETMQEKAKGGK